MLVQTRTELENAFASIELLRSVESTSVEAWEGDPPLGVKKGEAWEGDPPLGVKKGAVAPLLVRIYFWDNLHPVPLPSPPLALPLAEPYTAASRLPLPDRSDRCS